jgi:Peptidase family M48
VVSFDLGGWWRPRKIGAAGVHASLWGSMSESSRVRQGPHERVFGRIVRLSTVIRNDSMSGEGNPTGLEWQLPHCEDMIKRAMRTLNKILLIGAFVAAMPGRADRAQQLSVNDVIDRIVQREGDETKMLRQYEPVIETYVQDTRPVQQLGIVPTADHYFLGKAILSRGTVQLSSGGKKKVKHPAVKLGGLSGVFSKESVPDGFLQMIYIDSKDFDRQHYRLDFVRRELLGEVHCLVFDVTPLKDVEGDHFLGRIWVEDQSYTIVRFNGANFPAEHPKGFRLHFDSWRANVAPGVWIPAYIYSAESEAHDFLPSHLVFQAQTRFWGYKPMAKDEDRSQVESRPSQEREIEESAVERLEATGLLAPQGDVDKILSTVVNNLEVSNDLDIEPEVQCRVLLTSTLESFPIGHTILISRGLLDVLPDESSLGMVLAHELGHMMSSHSLGDEWALRDWSNFYFEDGFNHFGFPIDIHIEDAANAKGLEVFKKSPYKEKMVSTVLFLQAVDSQAKTLPNLISPHVVSRVPIAAQLSNTPHDAMAKEEGQTPEMPLGSRVLLDPWADQLEIMRDRPMASASKRGRQPFQISPFLPYLVQSSAAGGAPQRRTDATSGSKENE